MYERLKRETVDRNFSEVIAATYDRGARLMDVTAARVFDDETIRSVDEEFGHDSDRAMNDLTDDGGIE